VKETQSQKKTKKLQLNAANMKSESYFTPQKKKAVCNSQRGKLMATEVQFRHTTEGVFFQTPYDPKQDKQNHFFINYNFYRQQEIWLPDV
jgi:hypothetical protein